MTNQNAKYQFPICSLCSTFRRLCDAIQILGAMSSKKPTRTSLIKPAFGTSGSPSSAVGPFLRSVSPFGRPDLKKSPRPSRRPPAFKTMPSCVRRWLASSLDLVRPKTPVNASCVNAWLSKGTVKLKFKVWSGVAPRHEGCPGPDRARKRPLVHTQEVSPRLFLLDFFGVFLKL